MVRSLILLALPAVALASPPSAGGLAGGESGLDTPDARDFEAEESSVRIINGTNATIGEYPQTGMLVFDGTISIPGFGDTEGPLPVCSSTLIAPDVVLLAAHCIDPAALTFGFGELTEEAWGWSRQADLSSVQPGDALPEDTIMAAEVLMHPDFDLQGIGLGLAENADIALMFLDTPVLDVQPAVLPTLEEAAEITLDAEVVIVGWGQSIATGQFEQPPAGSIYIKNVATTHISEIADYEMKIGEEQTDGRKCHGDSGGPTFLTMSNVDQPVIDRLVGVTSHAYDETDCFETGGVDTRVDFYLDWIDEEMRKRCEDGTRVWCGVTDDEAGILPAPTFEDLEGKKFLGCSCSATSSPTAVGLWGLGLLALVGLRRRK